MLAYKTSLDMFVHLKRFIASASAFHGINEKVETLGALGPLYGSDRLKRGGSLCGLQLYTAVPNS